MSIFNNIPEHSFLGGIKTYIVLSLFRRQWKKNNPNNGTIPMNLFDTGRIMVGKESYGELNIISFGNETTLTIGNYVSIAQNVTFLLDVEHRTNSISTFPFRVKILHQSTSEAFSKGNIIVHDDVWIGYGSTILSGVTIGQGAVIAAGSIVTKDIPPYAIVAGSPARIIKYRFEEELRSELGHIDFGNLSVEMINEHVEILYSPLLNVSQLKWLPKKSEEI